MLFLTRVFWTKVLIVLALVGGAGAGLVWFTSPRRGPETAFRTATVLRGDLSATVSATGTIEPEEVIDVGAQVGGMIKSLGPDPGDSTRTVDYGTQVREGNVLAQIDDALYRARADRATAQVEQADAQLEQVRADVRRAEADLGQLRARLEQAERDWQRARKAMLTRSIAEAEYDAFRAAAEVARANTRVGEAAVAQSRASKQRAEKAIAVARAELREARQNLAYTTIRSPVSGVIIDRRVNVGQTVVASLNAPSLFLIARDLKRLQVWVAVNEADIAQIRPGQPVRFTVDAYPEEVFRGEVAQVRLNANMTQNVVTYTVVVSTDNSSGRLLPYLTANVQLEIARHQNVLLVPNAALRWQPREQQGSRPAAGTPAETGDGKSRDRGVVWVEEGDSVQAVEVGVGLTDGVLTEVSGDGLHQGSLVVVGDSPQGDASNTGSPFAPRFFGGRNR
jgi:HlyD family secretion protein